MLRFLMTAHVLIAFVAAENVHKVFRVNPKSEEQLKILHELDDVKGYNFWKSPGLTSYSADVMVAPERLQNFTEIMTLNDMTYESFIENVEALLKAESSSNRTRTRATTFDWTTYHNLVEIYSWLDSLAKRYPDKVEVIVGGRSYENRDIKGVKVSFAQGNPGIFIEGGIHAREWISHATVTYLLNQLLTSNDSAIRKLAESHDWYIFPVFNPDGYAYTHINPRDINYRLWRKTRSPNKGLFPIYNCYGTDMNRNWGFEWMTIGASNKPCSESYAGRAPFSEVETKTLSTYISSISDKLFAYVAFHSYSQLLMLPYGHTKSHLDNYAEQKAIAQKAAETLSKRYGTQYRTGNIAETIGFASGGSVDWVKAKLKLPLVFVYELRDRGNKGFILPANQIIPTGEEIMDSLVALFEEAKKYGYPSN